MNRLVGSYSMLPDLPDEVTGSSACKPTCDGVEAVFLRDKEADRSGQWRILDKSGANRGCQHVIQLLRGLKRLNRPTPGWTPVSHPVYHHETILEPQTTKKSLTTQPALLQAGRGLGSTGALYRLPRHRRPQSGGTSQTLMRISPAAFDRLHKPLRVKPATGF